MQGRKTQGMAPRRLDLTREELKAENDENEERLDDLASGREDSDTNR